MNTGDLAGMRWTLLFFFGCLAVSSWPAEDLRKEPPLTYTLIIDGQRVPVEVGKEVAVAGQFRDPRVKLEVGSTRTFQFAGVKFDYPGAFGWEADVEDPDTVNWTLSGNDYKIMVFQKTVLEPDQLARSIATGLDADPEAIVAVEETIAGQKLKGFRIRTKIVGTLSVTVVLATPSGAILVLQDTPPDGSEVSVENKACRELLNKTLSFPKK